MRKLSMRKLGLGKAHYGRFWAICRVKTNRRTSLRLTTDRAEVTCKRCKRVLKAKDKRLFRKSMKLGWR